MPDVRDRATDQQTISRGTVAICKDFLGRGPTTAQTTGRHAAAFLSDHDVERDIAIETIVLEAF